jgi:hypothetical protein
MKAHGINPDPECPLFSDVVPEFAAIEHLSLSDLQALQKRMVAQ